MKSIMISIQPQWVEKICNKEKTIEVRKTVPKCELPCRVYIYCTQGKRKLVEVLRKGEIKWFGKDENDRYEENTFITIPHYDYGDKRHDMLGKVVAEFTLDKVETIERDLNDWLPKNRYEVLNEQLKNMQLSNEELWNYGKGKDLYAWHINNLKIYDKPKHLQEFFKPCDGCDKLNTSRCANEISDCRAKTLQRPPQSWFYCQGDE